MKPPSKREERDKISHAIHGWPVISVNKKGKVVGLKGVKIIGGKSKPKEPEKGVEIHESRHG